MSKIKPSRDIQPVTEFRANAAQFIEQVQATGEPVALTQHGRSAAVLLDVASYEGMLDELALLRDVRHAEQQVAAGTTVTHAAVAKKLQWCGPRWPSSGRSRPWIISLGTGRGRRRFGLRNCWSA